MNDNKASEVAEHNDFQFYPFSFKCHDIIFLYSCLKFDRVHVLHFLEALVH